MSLASLAGVGAALAFILGLVALLAWVAGRVGPRRALRSGRGVEVTSRAALGPRQGVATIRVAGRTALVSWGDGGVRMLMELEPEAPSEAGSDSGESDDAEAVPGDAVPFRAVLGRARRKAAGLRALLLFAALAAGSASPAPARAADGPTASAALPAPALQSAPAAAGPRAPTLPVQPGAAGAQTPAAPRAQQAAGPRTPSVSLTVGGADGEGLELSGPVGTVVFIGFMTLIPTLLLLMTGFTRILIVLHLLKQALGTQTAPPAHLLAALAVLLTTFVMAPTFQEVHRTALLPWMQGETDELTMLREAAVPMRAFMLDATREQDLASFVEMHPGPAPETIDDVPLTVVTSAFVTSELTAAFQMGFALFLPFVIIDLVVASVLMSMGMFMLPPVMVSLPFKLLLFVLVDGWALVLGSLVRSF